MVNKLYVYINFLVYYFCRKQFICFEGVKEDHNMSESIARIAGLYESTVPVNSIDSETWDGLAFSFGLQAC